MLKVQVALEMEAKPRLSGDNFVVATDYDLCVRADITCKETDVRRPPRGFKDTEGSASTG